MNRNQKIAFAEKELKVKDIGFKLNLHPGYIGSVLSGKHKTPKVRKEICEILEKEESYLWPNEAK